MEIFSLEPSIFSFDLPIETILLILLALDSVVNHPDVGGETTVITASSFSDVVTFRMLDEIGAFPAAGTENREVVMEIWKKWGFDERGSLEIRGRG